MLGRLRLDRAISCNYTASRLSCIFASSANDEYVTFTRVVSFLGHEIRMAESCNLGFATAAPVHVNVPPPQLIEQAVQRREAVLDDRGALVAVTQPHTGRAAKDKYVVAGPASEPHVWWNDVNQRLSSEAFEGIRRRAEGHLG